VKKILQNIFGMQLLQPYLGNAQTDIRILIRWANVREIRSKA